MEQALRTISRTASGTQVGAAGRTLGLVEVHRDAQRAIPLVLDGLDFPQTHGHIEPLLQADISLGLRGPRLARLAQRECGDVGQFLDPGCVYGLGHGP